MNTDLYDVFQNDTIVFSGSLRECLAFVLGHFSPKYKIERRIDAKEVQEYPTFREF